MNLLTDAWIPVLEQRRFRQITYRELLCNDGEWKLSLPRDDMELAALQLLISLTQTVFMPKDKSELRQRAEKPMNEDFFKQRIESFAEWFVLDHPETPFMQTKNIKAKEETPIQKLFIGLPEGNNHAFFNEPGEVHRICGSCAAISLFNQASVCPSFGGGFKGGLRGSAPISTMIYDDRLRVSIWKNVLNQEQVNKILPDSPGIQNKPVWMIPIRSGDEIFPHQIGLTRGLFWQPAHVELISASDDGICDSCGIASGKLFSGF